MIDSVRSEVGQKVRVDRRRDGEVDVTSIQRVVVIQFVGLDVVVKINRSVPRQLDRTGRHRDTLEVRRLAGNYTTTTFNIAESPWIAAESQALSRRQELYISPMHCDAVSTS